MGPDFIKGEVSAHKFLKLGRVIIITIKLTQKEISLNVNFRLAYHEICLPPQRSSISKPILNMLLIHAYPLSSSMYLHTFTEPYLVEFANLESPFQINLYCPDLPGFGESTLLSEKPLTLMPIVEILYKFCRKLELKNIIIGGCSMGGYLSLAFAQKYPELLKGIILLDTKAEADSSDARNVRLNNISMIEKELCQISQKNFEPAIGELMDRNPSINDMIYGLFQKLIFHPNLNSEKLATLLIKEIKSQKAIALTHSLSAMAGRKDSHSILANLTIPILIIVGDQDIITPIAAAQAIQKSAGQKSELCIIQNAGHLAIMEQAANCLKCIRNWLEKIL